jgi:hypothetical protein
MINLTLVAQQLEIPYQELKSICQILRIEIVKDGIAPQDKQKIQEFLTVCKDKGISVKQGLEELLWLQQEAQAQQKVMGERFNLDEFFKQRMGIDPKQLNPGSYHYDLYQLLLKSESISQVGYALFREAFLRQTQDLILNGTKETGIEKNQTVGGFESAFDAVEAQFEQNFLGTSVNWGEGEHPMLAASAQASLPSAPQTTTSPSPSSKK